MLGRLLVGLAAAVPLALGVLFPAAALAAGDDDGVATVFAMHARNGYRLFVIGQAEADDGQGEVSMYLVDKGAAAWTSSCGRPGSGEVPRPRRLPRRDGNL